MICPALTSAAERVEDVNSGGHWIMIPRGTGEFTVKKKNIRFSLWSEKRWI